MKREDMRDSCIVLTMLVVLCFAFKGFSKASKGDDCRACDRMEQTMSGMRQRMAPQQQRGSRSSEGRGEWKKEGKEKK